MPETLTQTILDRGGCDTPGCTEPHDVLYLVGYCHPRAGLVARYDKPTGLLTLTCKACPAKVAVVKVAER